MNTNTNEIKITPSVSNVFSATGEVSSWGIVQSLLRNHGEYAGQRGRQIAEGNGPKNLENKAYERWLQEVLALFDSEMVRELHGRLLIMGLCQLDNKLKTFLDRIGFLTPIAEELQEDFESLLLPEFSGEMAYKRTFLKKLNNKPEYGNKQRANGFVAIVHGGPGLKDMAALCQRQVWNKCYTVRYVLDPTLPIAEAVNQFSQDLANLSSGSTMGDFHPDLSTDADAWEKDIKKWIKIDSPKFSKLSMNAKDKSNFLETGKRLVILIEFRRMPANASPASIHFQDLIAAIQDIPERLCLVISGLPLGITSRLDTHQSESDPSAPVITLNIPKDLELTRSQPLSNDIPSGADQLNLMSEVNAIAEAMTLKDLNPPLVVGILGGWGAGKSFILHLIKNRIQEIRCEPVNGPDDPGFPFVGHPYIINFDAWTFAKGNLWASLMQQIFMELDRQIGLEQMLTKKLGKDLKKGQNTEIWRLLNELSDEERTRISTTDLGIKAIKIVDQIKSGDMPETKLWDVLEKLKSKEVTKLRGIEQKLEETLLEHNELKYELKKTIDQQIEKDAHREAITTMNDQLLQSAWDALFKNDDEKQTVPTFAQLKNALSWKDIFKKESKTYIFGLVVFALLGALIVYIPDFEMPFKFGFSGITGLLGSLFTGYYKFQQWAKDTRVKFDASVADNRKDPQQAYDKAILDAANTNSGKETGAVTEKAAAIIESEQKLEGFQNQVNSIRQRVGMASRHRNLLEFVENRLDDKAYENKLGLLHQVKEDLEELSDALMHDDGTTRLFQRGKPRIMLLIDDLDRCPPPKVVEVLEAAQLLVKTSLFIVVIAMDVRYVTRALEHEYAGVLSPYGEPSGLDYIEKIIQIPYRVRPASESAVESFLWGQMSPKVDKANGQSDTINVQSDSGINGGPPNEKNEFSEGEEGRTPVSYSQQTELRILPTETLHFSKEEYEMIAECCSVFDVSPRTMKRLVNVFKLMKIIWYRDKMGNGPADDIKKTMLSILVISARYPEQMRELLHLMERKYVQEDVIADLNVVEFLTKHCLKNKEIALIPQAWTEVSEALSNEDLVSQEITFAELHEQHLHLVSSFSFVGESDPQRQVELQKRGAHIDKS